MELGTAGIAAITVIAYLIGRIFKAARLGTRWIPVICGSVGAVLGIAGLYIMPDFPADNVISAAAVGIVSGLAATGANECVKQLQEKGATQKDA